VLVARKGVKVADGVPGSLVGEWIVDVFPRSTE
jgi:hypothetical protein